MRCSPPQRALSPFACGRDEGHLISLAASQLASCLAAARSRRGSDMPPACHSLPRRRFATLKGKPRRFVFVEAPGGAAKRRRAFPLGGRWLDGRRAQWGPRENPAKRFSWGEEERWSARGLPAGRPETQLSARRRDEVAPVLRPPSPVPPAGDSLPPPWGRWLDGRRAQWGPRGNPAKRFPWGEEERWSVRAFAPARKRDSAKSATPSLPLEGKVS